jgi:16S rRNA (uracil1498-N3)-methyltransferase
MALFYHSTISEDATSVFLSEEESKHCVRVLRMVNGSLLTLVNGFGASFEVKITAANPKKCEVEIVSYSHHAPPAFPIHIAIAPTKNMDRMEWFVEKATELGMTKMSLLRCQFSERKAINLERLQKIAIAAMKQSKRYYLPVIEEQVSFADFIKANPVGSIAHCYDSPKKKVNGLLLKGPLLIGPEGDFSVDEVALAENSGYSSISLGDYRLRTETAALLAVFHASIAQGI